jgi:hypothetical protein
MNGMAPRLRGGALRAVLPRGSHLQIIASGVVPSGVVAFTFTEWAAEAPKSRSELRCDVRTLCRFAAMNPASSARPRGRRAGGA